MIVDRWAGRSCLDIRRTSRPGIYSVRIVQAQCPTIGYLRVGCIRSWQTPAKSPAKPQAWLPLGPLSRAPPPALADCGPLPRSSRSGHCGCSSATQRGTGRSQSSRAPPLRASAISGCRPPARSTVRSRQDAARQPAAGQMQAYSGSRPNTPRGRCPRQVSPRTPLTGQWAQGSPG